MDRLICGDVGFGNRSGNACGLHRRRAKRQVAILAPPPFSPSALLKLFSAGLKVTAEYRRLK